VLISTVNLSFTITAEVKGRTESTRDKQAFASLTVTIEVRVSNGNQVNKKKKHPRAEHTYENKLGFRHAPEPALATRTNAVRVAPGVRGSIVFLRCHNFPSYRNRGRLGSNA
jgi:hypothetical protein